MLPRLFFKKNNSGAERIGYPEYRLDEKNWVDRWLRLDIQVYLRDL